jgi:F0F1-type ATP synthase assembly protein I
MINPSRSQFAFIVAIVVGLLLGKLIKNFKIAFVVALLVGVLITFGGSAFKKRHGSRPQ